MRVVQGRVAFDGYGLLAIGGFCGHLLLSHTGKGGTEGRRGERSHVLFGLLDVQIPFAGVAPGPHVFLHFLVLFILVAAILDFFGSGNRRRFLDHVTQVGNAVIVLVAVLGEEIGAAVLFLIALIGHFID